MDLLHNPVYAGAYAFGRHRTRQHVDADGGVHARTRAVARDQWQVLIRDHHEGYITWDDYLAIEAKMAANQTSGGARPPREGSALCQGIIYCGCGRHMGVHYHDDGRAYYACRARSDRQATPDCQHASAAAVDAAVTQALFTAIAPDELALAIAAAGEVTARRHRVTRAAELAAERARYQADRAERAFLRLRTGEPPRRPHPGNPVGSTAPPSSPTPKPPWPPSSPARPRSPNPASSPKPRHACPASGTRPPPATRTANGCCAPCSATSPSCPPAIPPS